LTSPWLAGAEEQRNASASSTIWNLVRTKYKTEASPISAAPADSLNH
jgi:hypothetical protein